MVYHEAILSLWNIYFFLLKFGLLQIQNSWIIAEMKNNK